MGSSILFPILGGTFLFAMNEGPSRIHAGNAIAFWCKNLRTFDRAVESNQIFAIIGCEVSDFVLQGEMADLVRTILIVSAVITLVVTASIATKLIIRNNHKSPLS